MSITGGSAPYGGLGARARVGLADRARVDAFCAQHLPILSQVRVRKVAGAVWSRAARRVARSQGALWESRAGEVVLVKRGPAQRRLCPSHRLAVRARGRVRSRRSRRVGLDARKTMGHCGRRTARGNEWTRRARQRGRDAGKEHAALEQARREG